MALLPRRTRIIVDRLAWRAHAFHRFAHHPLCDRYASELIPLGRRARLCRGCANAALGAVSGALGGLLLRPHLGVLLAATALGLSLLLGSLSLRLPKWLGRGLAVASVSFAVFGGLPSAHGRPLAIGLLTLTVVFITLYRKRGPNRAPCPTCPERELPKTCSGFLPIVQRERAFRRVAQRAIDAASTSSHG